MASKTNSKSVLAREDDGTIQLTLTIPAQLVQAKKEEALKSLAGKLEIPGFRKGKVPADIAEKRIGKDDLYNETLQKLLPETYAAAVEEHKLRPVLAPRFEIVSIDEENDWTIRAVTCEMPQVEVGDYKKYVGGTKIWTPTQGKTENKEASREDKEQKVLESIIANAKATISKALIEEEINHKLSLLLDQTQKLGLTVEQYLASTGKTIESLRADLAQQAQEAIKLELALNQIANEEKISVSDEEVTQVIKTSDKDQQNVSDSQRAMVAGVLKRRKALDKLLKPNLMP
ncbi:MAG: trigger factor [Patescibacteria group bacterium]